nr:hypothetical protein MACL_00000850 [Theileria orientalis]
MELSDSDYENNPEDRKYQRFPRNRRPTQQIPAMSHMNPHQPPNNGLGTQLQNTSVSFDLNTGAGGGFPQFSSSDNGTMNEMFPAPDSASSNKNPVFPEGLSNISNTSRSNNEEPDQKYEMEDPNRVEEGTMDMFRYEPESMMDSKKESLTDSKLMQPRRMGPMFPFTQQVPKEGAGKDFSKGKDSSRDLGKKEAKHKHTQQRRQSESQETFKGITASVELREICQLESWKELVQRNKVMYKQGDVSIEDSIEMEEEEEEEGENEEHEKSEPEVQDADKKKHIRNPETSWAVNRFRDIKETEGLSMEIRLFTEEDLKNKDMKDLKRALKTLAKQETKVYPYQTIDYPTQISKPSTTKDYLWYSDTSAESDKEEGLNTGVNGEVITKNVEKFDKELKEHRETNIEDELEMEGILGEFEEVEEEEEKMREKGVNVEQGYNKKVVDVNGMKKEIVMRVKNEEEREEEYDLNVELEKVLELNDEPQHMTNVETEFDADLYNTATQMSLASALDATRREEDRYKMFGELEELNREFDLNDYRYEWYKYRSGLEEKLTISHFIEFDQIMKKKFKIKVSSWKEDEKEEENVGQVQKLYAVAETNMKLLMHYDHPEVSNIVNSQIYDLNTSKVLYTFGNEEEQKTQKDDLVALLEEATGVNSTATAAGTSRETGGPAKESKDKEQKEVKEGKEVVKELEKELEKELGKEEEALLTGKESDVRRQWRKRLQGIDKQKRLKLVNQGVSLSCLDNETALESSRNYDFVYEFDEVAAMFRTSDYLGILNHSFDAHYAASNPHDVGQDDEVLNKRDLIHTRVARNIVGILPLVGKNAKIQLARFHRMDFRTGMFKMSVIYYTHDIERELRKRKYTDKSESKKEQEPEGESVRQVSAGTNTSSYQGAESLLTQTTQSIGSGLSQNTQSMSAVSLQNTLSIGTGPSQNTQSMSAVSLQNTQSPTTNTVPHTEDGEGEKVGMEEYGNVDGRGQASRREEELKAEETKEGAPERKEAGANGYQPTEMGALNRVNQTAGISDVKEYGALEGAHKKGKSYTPPNYWEEELEKEGAGVEWEVYTVERSVINMNFREDDIVEGVQNHCSNYFVNSEDLSLADDTKLVLLEYVEKYPLLMNNLGMTSRVDTYINTNAGEGIFKQSHKKGVLGNVTYAQEYELFGVQHRLKNNETQSILENTLFRAPIFYRTSNPRHYRQPEARFGDRASEEYGAATSSGYSSINWDRGLVDGDFAHPYDETGAEAPSEESSARNTHEAGTADDTHGEDGGAGNSVNTRGDNSTISNTNYASSNNNTNSAGSNNNTNYASSNNNDEKGENEEPEKEITSEKTTMYDFLLVRTKLTSVGAEYKNGSVNGMSTKANSSVVLNEGKEIMRIRSLDDNLVLGVVGQCEPKVLIHNPKSKSYTDDNKLLLKAWVIKMAMMYPGLDVKKLKKLARKKFYPLLPDKEITAVLKQIEATAVFSTRPQALENTLQSTIKPEVICSLESTRAQRFRLKSRGITHLKSHDGIASVSSILSQQEVHFASSIAQATKKLNELKKRYYTRMATLNVDEEIIKEKIRYFNLPIKEYTLYGHPPLTSTEMEEEGQKVESGKTDEINRDYKAVEGNDAHSNCEAKEAYKSDFDGMEGVNGSGGNIGTLETINLDDIEDGQYLDNSTDGHYINNNNDGQYLDNNNDGQYLDNNNDGQYLDNSNDGQYRDIVGEVTQQSGTGGVSYRNVNDTEQKGEDGIDSTRERGSIKRTGDERNESKVNSEYKNSESVKKEREHERSAKRRKLKTKERSRNRGNISSKVEYIEKELKLSNWNITHDVKMVLKGNGQFSLHGLGDPSNSGLALSLIKRQVNTGGSASTTGNVYNMSLVGQSNEDLRKLSMDELSKRLQLYGVSEAIIKTLPRWDQVALVRQYRDGYGAAKNVDDPLNKFRIPPQEYKNQLTKIIQKQKESLAQTAIYSPLSLNRLNSLMSVMKMEEEEDKKSTETRGGEGASEKEGFGREELYDELEKEQEELKLLKESLNLKKKIEDVIEDEKLIPVPGLMWLRQSRKTPSEPFGNERAVFVYGEKNIAKVLEWRSQCARRRKTQIPAETVFGVNIGKRVCRNCGQQGHIASNPKCPLYAGDKMKHEQAYLKQQQKKQEVDQDSSDDGLITSRAAVSRNTKEHIKSNMGTLKMADSDTEASDLHVLSGDSSTQLGLDGKHRSTGALPQLASKRRRGGEEAKDQSESSKLSSVDLKIIAKILATVEKEARYRPFVARVPEAIAPNYYELIQRPMWLSLLKSRVRSKDYGSVEDLVKDIFLLEINCKTYNSEHSQNAWLRGVSQTLVDDLSNRIKNHVQNKAHCKTIDRLLSEHKAGYRGSKKTQLQSAQGTSLEPGQQEMAPAAGQQDQAKNLEKLNELVKLVEQGKPIELEHLKELKQMMQTTQQLQQLHQGQYGQQLNQGQQLQKEQGQLDTGTQQTQRTDVNVSSSTGQQGVGAMPGLASMTDIGNIATMGSMDSASGSMTQPGLGAMGSMSGMGPMGSMGSMGSMSGMSQTGMGSIDPLNPMTGVMSTMVGVGAMANMENLMNMGEQMTNMTQYTGAYGNYSGLNIFDGDMAQYEANMGQYDSNMGEYAPGVGGYEGTYEQFEAEMGQFGGEMGAEYVIKDEEMMKMQMSQYGAMGVSAEGNYGTEEATASGATENEAEGVLGPEEVFEKNFEEGFEEVFDEVLEKGFEQRKNGAADNSVSASAADSEMGSVANDQDDSSAV